jgi:A/G-specific adenine glycosylase
MAQQMSWRPKSIAAFRKQLLRWFRANQCVHPWRRDRDPYRVWLAEVMLQQTRIAAVIPYYDNFLGHFPDVRALAQASEQDVLRHWAGLGYYSRARNLHRAAKEIVERHGGAFPRDLGAVLKLPGIGRYTAAAVLSIAYGAPYAVLDGNVARVLARLGAIRGDLRAPRQWQQLAAKSQELLAVQSAGNWNQAMMELGETVCTPKSPNCEACPVNGFCAALKRGLVNEIPEPRKKRSPLRQRIEAAVLLDPRGRTLLVRDPGAHDDVLFSRMWQFPAVQTTGNGGAELAKHLLDKYGFVPIVLTELALAKHCVTFRNITLAPFLARVSELPKIARSRALPLSELNRVPISSATRKIAAAALDAIDSGVTDRGRARNGRAS